MKVDVVDVSEICGHFAENKDLARKIRENYLKKWLRTDGIIILDFKNIDSSTQSFVHAMISFIFQKYGEKMLVKFEFKNCNAAVKSLITTVINYSLETTENS